MNRSWLLAGITITILLASPTAQAGLQKYSSFVVADSTARATITPQAIRITYLGVNGYQLETDNHVLLVDPYFTRAGLWSVAFNQPIQSQCLRVDEGFAHLRKSADAILVTHAHFDHLLDVPDLMQRTGARLTSGPTAIKLAESLGADATKCESVSPGAVRNIGPWMIRVLPAQHDRLFGSIPFSGGTGSIPPRKPSDWKVGEPLAFVIEANTWRIYIDSGGVPNAVPPKNIGPVDLAILGVALPDSRARFAEIVQRLRPHYVLPSHQDDFFAPLNRGFTFGKLTNFPQIIRLHQREHLPGRLILLDYFLPWTLR